MDKNIVHNTCLEILKEKIKQCDVIIANIDESALTEEKSSSGDKFETLREMLQQELDQVTVQKSHLLDQMDELKMINPRASRSEVTKGALVETNQGIFYISTALGKMKIDNTMAYAISSDSPMAQQLWEKTTGQQAVVNGREVKILSIK
jgi:transcription elongation GreA/GreB family factor